MTKIKIDEEKQHFKYFFWVSFVSHVSIILFFSLKALFLPDQPFQYVPAIQVDIVDLPDKKDPTQKSSFEKLNQLPKNEQKKISLLEQKTNDLEAINLKREKGKSKETEALNKLKKMEAFEKIKKEIDRETRVKNLAQESKKISQKEKGNLLSSGADLTGLSKLQFEDYLGQVEKHIKSHWTLPQWLAKKKLSAQIKIRFDERGYVTDKLIIKSSGNSTFDEIVTDTIQRASPVPPPPSKLSRIVNLEGVLLGFPE